MLNSLNTKPAYEYRVTYAQVPANFPDHELISEQLAKIAPKPPKGADWQLAGSTCLPTDNGLVICYQWERAFRRFDS